MLNFLYRKAALVVSEGRLPGGLNGGGLCTCEHRGGVGGGGPVVGKRCIEVVEADVEPVNSC